MEDDDEDVEEEEAAKTGSRSIQERRYGEDQRSEQMGAQKRLVMDTRSLSPPAQVTQSSSPSGSKLV